MDKIEIVPKSVVQQAYHHDGSYESAQAIFDWFLSNRTAPYASVQFIPIQEVHVVHFLDYEDDIDRGRSTVAPDWWFIRDRRGVFYTIPDGEFREIFTVKEKTDG